MSEINTTNVVGQPRLRTALDQVRPEMLALEQSELLPIIIDPLTAVSTARGALPQIMKYHSQIVALPGFERNHIDQLETYARATHHAQTLLLAASAPPEHFAALVDECTTLREQLLNDATALSRRELISASPLAGLKGSNGYKNVASDLMTLCNVLRAAWPRLVGKTCVTEAELERAEVLSDQLINDVGLREQAPATIAAVSLERQQAFTLFVTAYDQVQRALAYLRWNEGDADDIAPSLYASRSTRKKTASDIDKKAEAATVAVSPVVPAAATTSATVTKASTGLPGADPFAS